jgi:hypothetical protein
MNGMHAWSPSQAEAAATVQAEPDACVAWSRRHVPHAEVALTLDGLAHSGLHMPAHGLPPSAHAQAWSSSARKACAGAGFFVMQIDVHVPASAGAPPAPPEPAPPVPAPPAPLELLEPLPLDELDELDELAWELDDVLAPAVPLEVEVAGALLLHA